MPPRPIPRNTAYGLRRKSPQVFGFKGVASKVFESQRLRLSKSAENGFGAVSRAVLVCDVPQNCPNQISIVARGWVLSQWISTTNGCDEKRHGVSAALSNKFLRTNMARNPTSRKSRDVGHAIFLHCQHFTTRGDSMVATRPGCTMMAKRNCRPRWSCEMHPFATFARWSHGLAASTLAQWFGAVGTIAAVIVALFKDPIMARRRRPQLVATCTKEIPWTVKTPIIARGPLPGQGLVTWNGDGYYVRVKVENTGRSRAQKVEVGAQELARRGADNRFVDIPTILPLDLKWANLGVAILDGISPKMSSFCDVIALCDPGNPLQRRPTGALQTVTIGQLQLEVDPFTDSHLLPPGAYRLTLRIAAANVEPIDRIVEFTHTGTWTQDDVAMRRDHLGVSLG